MRILLISTVSIIFSLLTSCAFHSGSISANIVPSNASYEDIAVGVSQSYKVIGIGGTAKDALVFEAKKQMFSNRPLGDNEAYANIAVDFKKTIVLIYAQTKVTVTADIIEIHPTEFESKYSDQYMAILDQGKLATDLFHLGDSIVDVKGVKAMIVSIESPEKVIIAYHSKKGDLKTKSKSIHDIYTNQASNNGLSIGDKVSDAGSKGIVEYVGINNFLYRDEEGVIYHADYMITVVTVK